VKPSHIVYSQVSPCHKKTHPTKKEKQPIIKATLFADFKFFIFLISFIYNCFGTKVIILLVPALNYSTRGLNLGMNPLHSPIFVLSLQNGFRNNEQNRY